MAVGAPSNLVRESGRQALSEGATSLEIVGTLFAVADIVGAARLVKATPEIAHIAGFDIDRALESTQ